VQGEFKGCAQLLRPIEHRKTTSMHGK